MTASRRVFLAALLTSSCFCARAAERPSAPLALAARLADCAAPAFRSAGMDVERGSGGFALQMVSDRHWVELAGRASFALVSAASGDPIAGVRVDQPAPGQFAQQQRWREHALLDAAARSGASLRQLELPLGMRLVTLNKRGMEGKYAGISVLSDPGRGLFVQWQWMRLEAYGGAGDLDGVQAAVWREVLPCIGEPDAR